jgi:hypothetical protein
MQMIKLRFILNRQDKEAQEKIIQKLSELARNANIAFTLESAEQGIYYSRHEPTEVVLVINTNEKATIADIAKLFGCTWRGTDVSLLWNSVKHPQETCLDETIDWAKIGITYPDDDNDEEEENKQ